MKTINKHLISKTSNGWIVALLVAMFCLQLPSFVNASPILKATEGNGVNEDANGPLDDPWVKFCFFNVDADELNNCINGWPANPDNERYEIVRKHTYEFVLINEKPTQQTVSFICPHEFGAACNDLIEAVLAFGGKCEDGINNVTCDLPD